MVHYICMDCGKLVKDDEPHVFYKRRHYHFTCWYALKNLPEDKEEGNYPSRVTEEEKVRLGFR